MSQFLIKLFINKGIKQHLFVYPDNLNIDHDEEK